MPIDAMHTDDMPTTVHPLAYYLSGPYGDLAEAIIQLEKRLDALEAKAAPVQDSQVMLPAITPAPFVVES
jgi:hypothetical protein